MSNFRTIDQELINPTINGMHYGGRPRVLARTQDCLLVWIPGYTSYVNRMVGRLYSRPAMILFHRRLHAAKGAVKICEGQRLSSKVFKDNAEAIDRYLGEGFHALLETNKTIVIGDNEPFSKYGSEIPITRRTFGYEENERRMKIRERLIEQGLTGFELAMAELREATKGSS